LDDREDRFSSVDPEKSMVGASGVVGDRSWCSFVVFVRGCVRGILEGFSRGARG